MTHLSIFQVCKFFDINNYIRKSYKHAGLYDFRTQWLVSKNVQTCMYGIGI